MGESDVEPAHPHWRPTPVLREAQFEIANHVTAPIRQRQRALALLLLIAVDLYLTPGQDHLRRLAIGASLIMASAMGIILHPNFKFMFHLGMDPFKTAGIPLLRTPHLPSLTFAGRQGLNTY